MNSNEDSWSSDSDNENDDEIVEEDLHFYPICCQKTFDVAASFSTLADAIEHDLVTNKFDVLEHLPPASCNNFFEKAIIFINKSRYFISSLDKNNDDFLDEEHLGNRLTDYFKANNDETSEKKEQFFKPCLEDDAFLMCMDDLQDLMKQREKETGTDEENTKIDEANPTTNELQMRIAALEEKLKLAKACITSLTIDSSDHPTSASVSKGTSQDNDTNYFGSYSHFSIHETMLQDTVRTKSYQDAISLNSMALFKDQVVIDIGCGTGILSLFAAKAGAKKVIAIDASDVYKEAINIVELNGFSNVITVLHGKVEDLIAQNKLPLEKKEKVNVIISEWMGYALFYESMLPSVLAVRDSYMNKDDGIGTMFPNGCSIFLEGASDSRLDYWDNVYEINMTPMKPRAARELAQNANVEMVDPENVVTNRVLLKTWNLNACRDEDLNFVVPFQLNLKEGSGDSVKLNKLVVSFDIAFNLPQTTPVYFSTGCQSKSTHWKQTTLWFNPIGGSPTINRGEVMRGTLHMGRNTDKPRDIDFLVMWEIGSLHSKENKDIFIRRCDGTIVNNLK